jgi:hypothetical protein
MTEMTGDEVVRATYDPIHDIGTTLFLNPETMGRASEWGWANPFAFYFAGRGGVLGDVEADVVAAAMGWFNPEIVAAMFAEGVAVAGARQAALRMVEANAIWGREHFADVGLDAFVPLADRLVDGADGGGLALFAGWRAQPRVDDVPGRAAQLFQILREWRGANHLVATTAVGLSPLQAILTNEGEGQARFFGWSDPFPDVSAIKALHADAEEMTNRLCATQFEALLSPSERVTFADGVAAAKAALPA